LHRDSQAQPHCTKTGPIVQSIAQKTAQTVQAYMHISEQHFVLISFYFLARLMLYTKPVRHNLWNSP